VKKSGNQQESATQISVEEIT